MAASTLAPHRLDVIDHDILPMTERGVAVGNKVFGAALLRKTDLSVVIAGTNAETDNPLLHGEVSTLNRFYEMPDRTSTRDLLFLSTLLLLLQLPGFAGRLRDPSRPEDPGRGLRAERRQLPTKERVLDCLLAGAGRVRTRAAEDGAAAARATHP
jgi:hypothetical protein